MTIWLCVIVQTVGEEWFTESICACLNWVERFRISQPVDSVIFTTIRKHTVEMWAAGKDLSDKAQERLPISTPVSGNSSIQRSCHSGHFRPHNPWGRLLAVPAFLMLLALLLTLGIFTTKGKKIKIKNNNNNNNSYLSNFNSHFTVSQKIKCGTSATIYTWYAIMLLTLVIASRLLHIFRWN